MHPHLRRSLLAAVLGATATSAFATKHIVTVQDFSFSPSSLTFCMGDTMQWQWVSGSHTTTSAALPAGAASWNSNMNSSTSTFTYVPTAPGTYNYVCTPHASMGMTGTFTVTAPPSQPGITPAGGSACTALQLTTATNPNAAHRWFFNGTAVTTGGTGNFFSANQSGSYAVRDSTACGTSMSNAVVVTINQPPASPAISETHSGVTYTFTSTAPSTGVSYSWNFGDGTPVSTLQSPVHAYTTGGAKVVTLTITTTTGSCSNDGALTVHPPLAIGTVIGLTPYSISPNPATSLITLHNGGNASVTLYDLTGRRIAALTHTAASGTDASYDIHDYPAGLYLLHISTPQGEGVLRLQIVK